MSDDKGNYDLQQFIDQLRQALQAADSPENVPKLARLLDEYGRLCEQANARLRECYDLIQHGQYADAVAVSEREPKLLEQLGVLELSERETLAAAAMYCGTSTPTLVDLRLVAPLQDAHQNLLLTSSKTSLLHNMNLMRAALPTRLAIMRKLLADQPNHPFLDGDIRNFERAWFGQALDFANRHAERGRADIVAEVIQDLRESSYYERPPSGLLPALQDLLKRTKAAQIPTLAEEIRQRFEHPSPAILGPLIERWNELVAAAGAPPEIVHDYGVAPAIDWYVQAVQDHRHAEKSHAAKMALEGLLQQRSPESQRLERAYHDARKVGAIDDQLETRYRSYLNQVAWRKRRVRSSVVGAVILVIAIAVGVPLVVLHGASHGAHDRTQNSPQKVDAGDFKQRAQQADTRTSSTAHDAPLERGENTVVAGGPSLPPPADASKRLAELDKRLTGLPASEKSLEMIASYLSGADWNLPHGFDSTRPNFTASCLPKWKQVLELQDALREDPLKAIELKTHWSDGQPPLAALAAAQRYAEARRQRDSTLPDSAAAQWLSTLAQPEFGKMWVVQKKGDDDITEDKRWYSEQKPFPNGSKDVVVLRDVTGQTTNAQFIPETMRVYEAPQFVFAEAIKQENWRATADGAWQSLLSKAYDALRKSDLMDPIIKFALLRKLLILADASSIGCRKQLASSQWYKTIKADTALEAGKTPMPGLSELFSLTQKNDMRWINPDSADDLKDSRKVADFLAGKSPRLDQFSGDAAQFDRDLESRIKRSVIVAGWITRDANGKVGVHRFAGAIPPPGGILYAVRDNTWIPLGTVGEKGDDLNSAADGYLAWPLFAINADAQ